MEDDKKKLSEQVKHPGAFLVVVGCSLGLLWVGISAPQWYHNYTYYNFGPATSEQLIQQRDDVRSVPEPNMCVGPTFDHETWALDYWLADRAERGAAITGSKNVPTDCVEEITQHYEDRGFVVVVVGNPQHTEQSIQVIATGDYQ
jgi:hypothetical protein